jgi:uncharacterized membrane protein YkgB
LNLKSGEYLNYIEIQKQPEKQGQGQVFKPSEKPTLILMHGFGSGLGMFFGQLVTHTPIYLTPFLITLPQIIMITLLKDLIGSLLWIGLEWEEVHVQNVLVLHDYLYLTGGVPLSQWIQQKLLTSLLIA